MSAASLSWPGRNHVAVFVHNLHLLDLDRLNDWPGVTISSFSTKASLQHRLRCVEWALYRLFELYDARTTRDKLRPFFPPASSLQSVNLRAALLRQLTDLKKDGVLGANVILRKTMLDECKGDKFEELLASFSIIVLQKSLKSSGQTLLLRPAKPSHAIPLAIAYRKGIQRDHEKRKEIELKARQQHKSLDTAIKEARAEAEATKGRKMPEMPSNADQLKKMLRENWIGDSAWVDEILHGVPATKGASTEFSDLEPPKERSLLADLSQRVEAHNARLGRWQSYLRSLQEQQAEHVATKETPSSSSARVPKFSQHKTLALHTARAKPEEARLKPQHASILNMLSTETLPADGTQFYPPKSHVQHVLSRHASDDSPTRPNVPLSRAASTSSTVSSQDTIIADRDSDRTPIKSHAGNRVLSQSPPSRSLTRTPTQGFSKSRMSLHERTRASLAHFDAVRSSPRGWGIESQKEEEEEEPGPTVIATASDQSRDRSSLLERTRQSMSLLANVLDDRYDPQSHARPRRSTHLRSKTAVDIPTQRRWLERAWSEESLASTATKDDLDVDADYESVFKSRPRLASSPNLSPQRSSNDLWLESQLEESMNKLTIESSPEY